MTEVFNFFTELAGNYDLIAFGIVGLIIFLLLIIMFTGKKKKSKRNLATGKDLQLDEVMEQLRDTSDSVQVLITEYRSKIGEQERLAMERQMQVQKLEEQIHQMQELQLLEGAPPELQQQIATISERKVAEVKQKSSRNNYSMLIVGFLLGVFGLLAGRFFANNSDMILSWLRQLGQ